jgi:hypothetical protein
MNHRPLRRGSAAQALSFGHVRRRHIAHGDGTAFSSQSQGQFTPHACPTSSDDRNFSCKILHCHYLSPQIVSPVPDDYLTTSINTPQKADPITV